MRAISALLILALSVLMMLIAPSLAQAQDTLWAKQWQGGYTQGLTVDRSHNVYRVGWFQETVDFDPGPGTFELTPFGEFDAFVSKLDRDGGFLWTGRLGGGPDTHAYSAALDDDGNIYISGYFTGTTDFDPGPGTFELTANYDAFVCKLDSSGNFVWVMAFQAEPLSAGASVGENVTVDGDHVYTAGYFDGTVDFDPGPGTFELTASGNMDLFVAKHDRAGNFVWAVLLAEGGDNTWSREVVVDPSGYVYTVGYFRGTSDFEPGPGTFNLTSLGERDGFVSKLDSAGNFVWAKQLGGALKDYALGVALDGNDNVYTVGLFRGTVDFDPGPGTFQLTSFGEADAFVSKLDSAGNFVWAKQLGGELDDKALGIALDSSDNVYTVGNFQDTVDFDPGPGTFELTSFGENDGFISKLDSAGNFVWAKQLGGASSDYVSTVVLDVGDNLYMGGTFSGTVDIDPGPGTFFLTSIDEWDIFISKYGYVDIRLENQDSTLIHFSPDSPSLSFDVATGLLSDLQADGDFDQATCLGTFSGNPAEDYSTPPVGDGYYYLARGLSCCTTQGYGDSTLIPDPRDDLNMVSPCP